MPNMPFWTSLWVANTFVVNNVPVKSAIADLRKSLTGTLYSVEIFSFVARFRNALTFT